ncbi:MAG TPA: rhomboid family intramembrane serine protease [Vicinamibacterales bacterium]|nr:rhomboid family intramembrane serine protease [Vicinamibacterales bacterium]
MRRHPSSPRSVSYSFGPGPVSPVIKVLIWTNVAFFVLAWVVPVIRAYLGLLPEAVFGRFFLWQPFTYLFLHAGFFHIIFNMLALWMFGVELERLWGSRFFLKYYLVTGVGAGLTTLAVALLPGEAGATVRYSITVGASGAIYGLLLAYALYFPNRPIYLWLLFPIPAKYFVLIIGGIALLSSMGANQGGVANIAHLGGLVFGYLYLRVWRARPLAEIKYRYFKWKMNHMRRRFDVYSGGRRDWDRKLH